MSDTAIERIRAMEHKRAEAMVAGDVDAIADLLDELRKSEYTYHSVELDTIDHQIVEGDLVIVNSLMSVSMTVRSSGKTVSRQLRATSVWVRADEGPGWRLVSHSTNLA